MSVSKRPSPITNEAAHQAAGQLFPGGVNSPVRAFRRVGGTPLTFARGHGPWLVDVAGRKYLDFNLAWGSLVHGHAPRFVTGPAARRMALGSSFGAPTREEIRLGSLVRDLVPGLERLRFVSSGTEAVMSALRLARAATGRDLVLKFDGCYHGHADSLLVAAGSGVAEGTSPDSAGIPAPVAALTLSVPYNDLAAVESAFARYPNAIAAILVEPLAANMGLVLPDDGFLAGLRRIASAHGSLLIFDEVITGFRVAPGGAQELYGIRADLVTFGKIIGGGFPAAAFGGRRELMELLAPLGPVYQAGTLSGNPVAMEAGVRTLERLARPGVRQVLDRNAAGFASGLSAWAGRQGASVSAQGSLMGISFRPTPPRNWQEVAGSDSAAYGRFFHAALDLGLYFAPSPFEALFISTAHRAKDLQRALRLLARLDGGAYAKGRSECP